MSDVRVFSDLGGSYFIGHICKNDTTLIEDLMVVAHNPQTNGLGVIPLNILSSKVSGSTVPIDPDKRGWIECTGIRQEIINQYIQARTGITLSSTIPYKANK
jgi:hypothetical protein